LDVIGGKVVSNTIMGQKQRGPQQNSFVRSARKEKGRKRKCRGGPGGPNRQGDGRRHHGPMGLVGWCSSPRSFSLSAPDPSRTGAGVAAFIPPGLGKPDHPWRCAGGVYVPFNVYSGRSRRRKKWLPSSIPRGRPSRRKRDESFGRTKFEEDPRARPRRGRSRSKRWRQGQCPNAERQKGLPGYVPDSRWISFGRGRGTWSKNTAEGHRLLPRGKGWLRPRRRFSGRAEESPSWPGPGRAFRSGEPGR